MKIEIDEDLVRKLWEDYQEFSGDESYYHHLASYLVEQVIEQMGLEEDI